MTNPIEELERLFAQTAQGERHAGRQRPFNVYGGSEGRAVLKGEDLITELPASEIIANARHAALMHNVTPVLLQLLSRIDDVAGEEKPSLGSWCDIVAANSNLLDALRKELEK